MASFRIIVANGYGCLSRRSTTFHLVAKDVVAPHWRLNTAALIGNYKALKKIENVEYPSDKNKLGVMQRMPNVGAGTKHLKVAKRLLDMRGPEETHTFLLHKQFGVRAIRGGQLNWGHLEMVRLTINRKIEESRMFGVWRVDPPWKPVTKKGQGHRMGGGKGNIDRFVTPVKAGRIIVEVGGDCLYEEVYPILRLVAEKMPFPAEVVTQKMLEEEVQKRQLDEKNNLNPFNFEYCLKNNFLGSLVWASPYDYLWHGKHR